MSSDDFYQKFRTGELGDDIDFFEWSVFYEMWLSAQQKIKSNNNQYESSKLLRLNTN
jgi:hypothetical protein